MYMYVHEGYIQTEDVSKVSYEMNVPGFYVESILLISMGIVLFI